MTSSVVLMLLLALTSAAPSCYFLSGRINDSFEQLHNKLGLEEEKPVFDSVINISSSLPRSDRVMVMKATLDLYLKMVSRLLASDQLGPGSGPAHKALLSLQKEMINLKKHSYHSNQENLVRSALKHLDNIQVDDPLVQKRGLAEFKLVYQAASWATSHHC